MNITAKHKYDLGRSIDEEIVSFFSRLLDGSDYEVGHLECAQRTATNNSEAIGRLVQLLAEKGVLSAAEVVSIAASLSSYEQPAFTNEQ